MRTRKLLCLMLATTTLLMSNGCSGGGVKSIEQPSTKDQQSTDTQEIKTSEKEIQSELAQIESLSETDKFGDLLLPFQGEWQCADNKYIKIVINGKDLNFINESTVGEKEYLSVHTFYFDIDEEEKLIVSNQYSQPRYKAVINEVGILTIDSLIREETVTYEKISDNTEVPVAKVEPAIGMTADEVKISTWGTPQKINKTKAETGEREQWVYESGYIYFKDGYVTSIQEVRP